MKMDRPWVKWLPLFMVTSLGLFLELSVIRWIAGEVRLFSYFKNLPLLAAFLGLSVEYALINGKRDYKRLSAPLLGLLVALTAAALRSGAGHVDAVEIDPTILSFGRRLHPERPYDDPRVAPIVDDARSFFERSTDRYDVIAFGLLDSHTLLSGLSSVRLDSFVYTIESFEQVRGHLTEDGLAVVTFAAIDSAPWIEERLGRMMVKVFGPDRVFFYRGDLSADARSGIIGTQVDIPLLRPNQPKGSISLWQLGDRVSLETAVPPVFGKEMCRVS